MKMSGDTDSLRLAFLQAVLIANRDKLIEGYRSMGYEVVDLQNHGRFDSTIEYDPPIISDKEIIDFLLEP